MTTKETLRFRLEKLREGLEQVVNKLSLNDTMKQDHRNSLVYDKQELLDEKNRIESIMHETLIEYGAACQVADTTKISVGAEIDTIRVTDNGEIAKRVTIAKCPSSNWQGMGVEFNELKGTFKAQANAKGVWVFNKGNVQLKEVK